MVQIKRRLTEAEIRAIREWIEKSPVDRKPSIRTIAKRLGVNRPSVIKSLGGWKGIERNRPQPPPKEISNIEVGQSPVQITPYTLDSE